MGNDLDCFKSSFKPPAESVIETRQAKVLIIGDISVGKTTLINCVKSGQSQRDKRYNATVGVDLKTKNMTVND